MKAQSTRTPRIGFLRADSIERAFIGLLYLMLAVLVALSLLGTFYGFQGVQAPLLAPSRLWADVAVNGGTFGLAVVVQLALSLTQYGSRQLASRDRRWWVLYVAALGVSVYYNVQAYWMPLNDVMPGYAAGLLIVAGDVLPEFIGVQHT